MLDRTVVRRLLAVALAATMFIGTPIGAAPPSPLTPGDVLVSNGTSLIEYTPSGGTVEAITVLPSPGATGISLRDIVVSPDGNLQVLDNGQVQCYLSTYNFATQTWSHNTLAGWTLQGVTYYGGISADSNYVYVPDLQTDRIPRRASSVSRWETCPLPSDLRQASAPMRSKWDWTE